MKKLSLALFLTLATASFVGAGPHGHLAQFLPSPALPEAGTVPEFDRCLVELLGAYLPGQTLQVLIGPFDTLLGPGIDPFRVQYILSYGDKAYSLEFMTDDPAGWQRYTKTSEAGGFLHGRNASRTYGNAWVAEVDGATSAFSVSLQPCSSLISQSGSHDHSHE
jgi:hypothetical protein